MAAHAQLWLELSVVRHKNGLSEQAESLHVQIKMSNYHHGACTQSKAKQSAGEKTRGYLHKAECDNMS